MVGSNYSDELQDRRSVDAWQADQAVGLHRRRWRSDHQGPHLVLRDGARRRAAPDDSRHLPEPQRRRPERVGVHARHEPRKRAAPRASSLYSARFTIQATPRNKFNVHWDWQVPCNGAAVTTDGDACRTQPDSGAVVGSLGLGGLTATTSPETAGYLHVLVQNRQFTWSSPVTNRLLLEAGLGSYVAKWGPIEPPGNPTRDLVRVTEQTAQQRRGRADLNYRSANWAGELRQPEHLARRGLVCHRRAQLQVRLHRRLPASRTSRTTATISTWPTRSTAALPSQLTQTLRVFKQMDRVRYTALYAQDQWTMGRMTLQGALRFDRAWSYSPEQTIGPTNFLPTQLSFPETPGVNAYKDISPRGGVAYDVFGNGKTSVKVNFGKYLEPASNLNGNYSISNPIARIATTTTRTWNDVGRGAGRHSRRLHPAVRSARWSTPTASAAGMNSPTFGTDQRTTAAIDPAILNGWNVRPGDWQIGASVQQQLMPRVSVEAGYFHRWLTHFTDHRQHRARGGRLHGVHVDGAVGSAAAWRRRLRGCRPATTSRRQASRRSPSNNVTFADNFGEQSQVYNGVLVNVTRARRERPDADGGVNTGKTVNDFCESARGCCRS